jgi:hypothetical protein
MSNLLSLYGNQNESTFLPPQSVNYSIESLTRDVYVKPLHSHNDYWRERPLFDALSVGCQSVESDIWLFPKEYHVERNVGNGSQVVTFSNNEIYVGHNQVFLDPSNTLNKMYLDPLFDFLSFSNPIFTYSDNSPGSPYLDGTDKHGIYWNSPETPLYFWMDFKTDANQTYEFVKPLIQRFIDNDLLAYYDAVEQKFVPGPVVMTITGNLPIEKVVAESKRYLFLDAPLSSFVNSVDDKELSKWSSLSAVASGSLKDILGDDYPSSRYNEFDENQKAKLKATFDNAHKHDLKTRVWGDIIWPNSLLNSHLRDFYGLGSDLLNVDNLKSASQLL